MVPGDSATALSVRLTGSSRSWRTPGFQILDPAAARFIPKAQYGRIHPGWQACVVQEMLAPRVASPPYQGAAPVRQPVGVSRITPMEWWWLVTMCSGAIAALFLIQVQAERQAVIARALRTFGAAFVQEFERPLIEDRGRRPAALRAQLTVRPHRRVLDVLLAPTRGRRYPNLADHRANVEYDTGRVMALLDDRRFICGRPEALGDWVRIPIRFVSDAQKEGGA